MCNVGGGQPDENVLTLAPALQDGLTSLLSVFSVGLESGATSGIDGPGLRVDNSWVSWCMDDVIVAMSD